MHILITGITGFIGGYVCQRVIDEGEHMVVGLVRPHSAKARYAKFADAVKVVGIALTDQPGLDELFAHYQFDWVFHIAAVRGGGRNSKDEFDRSNIHAPVVLANAALKYGAKFVFCSSVGVFGTIPQQLPPTEETRKVGDNYYHYSKIEAEKRLRTLQLKGLQLVIIRPIITYGIGDRGFPFLLMKLTEKGLLLLPSRDIRIHLVDVRTLVDAFLQAARKPRAIGEIYTVTDKTPVSLKGLVNHISMTLCGRPYPEWKLFPTTLYRLAEFGFEHILKSDAWMTRVKLMSHDWYYDGTLTAQELQIHLNETIPNFDYVIEWYKHVIRDA
jgi:dihydroflavonol-4-reductase